MPCPPARTTAPCGSRVRRALAAIGVGLTLVATACTAPRAVDPPEEGDLGAVAGATEDASATPQVDSDGPTSAADQGSDSEGIRPRPAPTATPRPLRLNVTPLRDPVSTLGLMPFAEVNADAWAAEVPQATEVLINASSDGAPQAAWWVPPARPDQPVLVVLHSWSTPYDQQLSIPYARWAVENGWGMIAPDFRGINDRPEATGSDLAVADVGDAVTFALAQGAGDPDRVFTVGFSGGAMMSVLMASRQPELFAAAIAWVPIHDLPAWYAYNAAEAPGVSYLAEIEASCGGAPLPGTPAEADCRSRSPSTWLAGARRAGVPIYLGVGLDDAVVPAADGARIFNQLAAAEDRIPDADVTQLGAGELPADLGLDPRATSFFGPSDPGVLATRRSGPVTLVVFDGEHEMLYGPGLAWLARGLPPPVDGP